MLKRARLLFGLALVTGCTVDGQVTVHRPMPQPPPCPTYVSACEPGSGPLRPAPAPRYEPPAPPAVRLEAPAPVEMQPPPEETRTAPAVEGPPLTPTMDEVPAGRPWTPVRKGKSA